jgi:hypothetical protein
MPTSKAASLLTREDTTPKHEIVMSTPSSDNAAAATEAADSNNSKKKFSKKDKRIKSKGTSRKGTGNVTNTIPSRAAEHEAGNSFINEYEKFHEAMLMLDSIEGRELSTEETSDALSSINSTISSEFGHYEVIEYDLSDPDGPFFSPDHQFTSFSNVHNFNLSPTKKDTKGVDSSMRPFPELNLLIQDNSPAAEALRANAGVHVSTAGKAARAVHLQSIRRFAKFAAGANKTGYIRGKPPRLPPTASRRADGPFGGPSRSESISEEPGEGFEEEEYSDIDHTPCVSGDDDDRKISSDDADLYQSSTGGSADITDEKPTSAPAISSSQVPDQQEIDEIALQKQAADAHQKLLNDTMLRAAATGHIPEGVAPGTIEAGKKGRVISSS